MTGPTTRPAPPVPEEESDRIALYRHPLRPRTLTVVQVTELTPRMARVRFTGPDLADFVTVAAEDHVKLFFDADESGEPRLPTVSADDRWETGHELTYRDYTVRAFDPDTLALDIDFVLHDHGVAGSWAARAQPGDRIGALGPRGSFHVKDVFDWYLLAVDETALPAAARWLESLRPEATAHVFVEVEGAADELALTSAADVTVTWLHRAGRPAGSTDLLEQAVRGFARPDGRGFTWVAGETLSIKPLRRYLKRDLGLDRDDFDVDGYWRRGLANHDHHEDPDDETEE